MTLAKTIAPGSKSALLIVQRDFMTVHVGVRRVIFFYWQRFIQSGYQVRIATPERGELFLAEYILCEQLMKRSHGAQQFVLPCWSSASPVYQDDPSATLLHDDRLRWTDEVAALTDFDVSIVTAPWLSALGLPRARYSAGILYDMIPNLVACGALAFDAPMNVYGFAHEHDLGNKFYIEYCDAIYAISESTKLDFINFYPMCAPSMVRRVLPFDVPVRPLFKSMISGISKPRSSGYNLIVVNAFDPRKNFSALSSALSIISKSVNLKITFVGRERAMPLADALSFLEGLRLCCADVEWYNNAGDAQLDQMYRKSDLLVFPSFYEGLGLPVLEAQSHGVPVICSGTSSGGEVNMNGNLCVDPTDHFALAEVVVAVLRRKIAYQRGGSLIRILREALQECNKIPVLDISTPKI